MTGTIAFQGVPGAYSDLACRVAYPDMTTLPCESFETAMDAVREGQAELAMLPCENSLAGRVPDIHHLLPESGLFVIGEHFHRVEHCLLGVKGAAIGDLKRAHSHTVALGPGAPQPAPAGADPGRAGGHGRRRATRRAVEPQGGGGDRVGAGGGDLRARYPRGERRGRLAQHDAVLRHGAPAADAGCGGAEPDDDVRVPRAERAGGAVQGARAGSRRTASI